MKLSNSWITPVLFAFLVPIRTITALSLPFVGQDHRQHVLSPMLESGILHDIGLESNGNQPRVAFSDLSAWGKQSKGGFLRSLKEGGADQWVIVVGNEAADTDTMVSSLATAYYLAHRKENPEKAVALMQVYREALQYRPENELLMKRAGLHPIHDELLTLDQLPWNRSKISQMIKGIVLCDHNRPLSYWRNVPVLGLIDHHEDRGLNRTASPRVIEMVGSTASLVTRLLLEETKHLKGTFPKQLADALFATISLDTGGLKKKKTTKVDKKSAESIFKHTTYKAKDLKKAAKELKKILKDSQEQIGNLTVTELYARDYKGDVMYNSTTPVLIGYANVPYRVSELIEKSDNKTREGLAHQSREWITANEIDVLVIMTKSKKETGEKVREIVLLVKHGHRLTEDEAERIYHKIRDSLEKDETLKLKAWHDEKDWGHQRFAWKQQGDGKGRKAIRPIVERAAQEW